MRQEITKTTLKSLHNKKLAISFHINKTNFQILFYIDRSYELIEVMK